MSLSMSTYTKSEGLCIKILANVLSDAEIWVFKLSTHLCCFYIDLDIFIK